MDLLLFSVLTYMANEMPKFIQQYNSQILPPIWQLLTQTADIYVKVLVNESDKSLFEDDTGKNSILCIFDI